jgi:hypothetical protein
MEQDIDLSSYEDAFSEASADAPFSRDAVPDDRYLVTVERVEISETRAGMALKWMLRILGPHHEGRVLWHCNTFGSVESMLWLKRDLKLCGIELGALSELPQRLHELLDLTVEVAKRTKGGRDRTYLNRCVRTRTQPPRETPGGRASF